MVTLTNKQQMEIKQVLQAELDCTQLLLKSLELEYEALAEYHTDALEDVVRDKLETVQQLEVISKKREKSLVSFETIAVDADQHQAKRYQFNDNRQLSDLWNELVNVAERCQQKNRVNGSIVESVSRQSRNALDILQGMTSDSSSISELYDNSGHTKAFTNKRSLVHV